MEFKNQIKFCPKCNMEKSIIDFPKNKTRSDGLHCYCKSCNNQHNEKYRKETKYHLKYYQENKQYFKDKLKIYKEKNKEQIYNQRKNYGLIKNYGISFEEKLIMCEKQEYKCKICCFSFLEKQLVVDHNHLTKEIRGLLCSDCNKGIGFFKENKEILLRAIGYL